MEVIEVTELESPFELFVRDHATNLLRTSFLLTGDRGAAEDLLQDTLTRLYPCWSRVLEAQAPVAYVRKCLTNEFLAARRRRSPMLVEFIAGDDGRSVPDIGETVAARDTTMRLLRALSERQRAAVVLRYFHGLDNSDIAEQLGCREATVRSLVSRGLIAMRAIENQAPLAAVKESYLP